MRQLFVSSYYLGHSSCRFIGLPFQVFYVNFSFVISFQCILFNTHRNKKNDQAFTWSQIGRKSVVLFRT